MNNITLYKEREIRRPIILEGISKDLSYSAIADQLGVTRYIVQKDIRTMQYNKDPELRKVYNEREEYKKNKHKKYVKKIETRFHRMTGISLEEKMFRNMIHFYKKEIGRVIGSENESLEIGNLSNKIRKIFIRNKIMKRGGSKYELTSKTRSFYYKQLRKRGDN